MDNRAIAHQPLAIAAVQPHGRVKAQQNLDAHQRDRARVGVAGQQIE